MARQGDILTFQFQGLTYTCPPVPPKKDIRSSSSRAIDQVYSRDTTYEQWDWNMNPGEGDLWYKDPSAEQMAWYESTIDKMLNGEWVMINGNPVYFNRYCYFFHQWFVLQEQAYPIYKDTSLEYFRFFELCEADPFCLGDCGIKGRRVGLSSMSASIKLLICLVENNTLQGIVSKTGTDAYEMFLFVKNGLENLPEFLMPDLNKVTESELFIGKPAVRITKNNTKASSDKGKNNRVNWLDTSEKAYDGRAIRHVTIDEAGKWKKNVRVCLQKISDTLVVGASVNGHVSMFSTVDKGDEGGDNFRIVWDGSNHIDGKKDIYGRTTTRMKRFFLPAYRGYRGYVGRYGESIIENPTPEQTEFLTHYIDPITKKKCPDPAVGARQWLQTGRDMLENDEEALAEEKRKNPFEWREVFQGANNDCVFNIRELNEQIETVKEYLELHPNYYRRGWFRKQDAGHVIFKDDPLGLWYIIDLLKPEDSNKSTNLYGERVPANVEYGAGGADLVANDEKTAERGSDACIFIHKRFNALDEENSNMPTGMYLGRPDNQDEFCEQMFWAAQYYGVRMLIERVPNYWKRWAENNGYLGYCIKTQRSIDGSEVYGVSPQNPDLREQHVTAMKEYAKINMQKIWFKHLLDQMVDFDPKNRLLYDTCMAWGYALMACREAVKQIAPAVVKQKVVKTYKLNTNKWAS